MALILTLTVNASAAESRMWTDATGRFSVEAEFQKYMAGEVYLKRSDSGKEISISIDQLSLTDQQYVRNLGRHSSVDEDPDQAEEVRVSPETTPPQPTIDEVTRFPVLQDGKWGYIGRDGVLAIPYQYDFAGEFRNGFAAAGVNEAIANRRAGGRNARTTGSTKVGLIDTTGRWIVEPSFSHVSHVSEGRAIADGRKCIDMSGHVLFETTLGSCSEFRDGLSRVRQNNSTYLFVDTSGRVAVKGPFSNADFFSEGMGPVAIRNERGAGYNEDFSRGQDMWGFVDRRGKLVIPHRYLEAREFGEGIAPVRFREPSAWGYIDHRGQTQIEPKYGGAMPFSEGRAWVYLQDPGQLGWYCIDRSEKVLFGPIVFAGRIPSSPFRGGLALINENVGNKLVVRYIDRDGTTVWQQSDAEQTAKTPPVKPPRGGGPARKSDNSDAEEEMLLDRVEELCDQLETGDRSEQLRAIAELAKLGPGARNSAAALMYAAHNAEDKKVRAAADVAFRQIFGRPVPSFPANKLKPRSTGPGSNKPQAPPGVIFD